MSTFTERWRQLNWDDIALPPISCINGAAKTWIRNFLVILKINHLAENRVPYNSPRTAGQRLC